MTATDTDEQRKTAAPHPTADRPRRASWLLPLLGAALLLTGGGMFLIGSSLPEMEPPEKIGGNLPINEGATDLLDISANNSPSIARNPVDPANLVVANRIDTPRFSCALHLSFDGGANWERRFIPFPLGEELPPRCFAPDVAFGPNGTLYLSFVTLEGLGNRPHATWIVSSDDGGRTLSLATRAAGPLAFQVRLTADPVVAERLYLSWVQAEDTANLAFPTPGNPILFARSDDGGETWSEPVTVNPPERERVVAPSTGVGPDGALRLLYLDLRDDRLDYHGAHGGRGGEPYAGTWHLVLARSDDGGQTWRESVVDDAVVPTERFVVFLPPSPSLAVDRDDGTVYAAFHDARFGDSDVLVWASDDQGATFTSPVRVNDTPPGDGTRQYMPRLAVAPDGRLDVVYYDRRADPENVMTGVSLQSSFDGADDFTASIPLSDQTFDSGIGFGSERGLPDIGSRIAVLSTDERAMAVWTDTRGGTEVSGKQDLARAVVAFSEPSPIRQPLRIAGVVLAGLGLVGIVAGVVPMVRNRRSGGRSDVPPGGDAGASSQPLTFEDDAVEQDAVDEVAGEEAPAGVPAAAGGVVADDPPSATEEEPPGAGAVFEGGGDPHVDQLPGDDETAHDLAEEEALPRPTDEDAPTLPADEPPGGVTTSPDDDRFERVAASPEPWVVGDGNAEVGAVDDPAPGAGLRPEEDVDIEDEASGSGPPSAGAGDWPFADAGDDDVADDDVGPPGAEPAQKPTFSVFPDEPAEAGWPGAESSEAESPKPPGAEPVQEPSSHPFSDEPPGAVPPPPETSGADPVWLSSDEPFGVGPSVDDSEPEQEDEPSFFLFSDEPPDDEPPEAEPPAADPTPSQEAKEAFPFFFADEPPEASPAGADEADDAPAPTPSGADIEADDALLGDFPSADRRAEEPGFKADAAGSEGSPDAVSGPPTAPTGDEGRR